MLFQCSGAELTLLATFFAIQIAICASEEELALLAALYTSIGDQLALIAVKDFEIAEKRKAVKQ